MSGASIYGAPSIKWGQLCLPPWVTIWMGLEVWLSGGLALCKHEDLSLEQWNLHKSGMW